MPLTVKILTKDGQCRSFKHYIVWKLVFSAGKTNEIDSNTGWGRRNLYRAYNCNFFKLQPPVNLLSVRARSSYSLLIEMLTRFLTILDFIRKEKKKCWYSVCYKLIRKRNSIFWPRSTCHLQVLSIWTNVKLVAW